MAQVAATHLRVPGIVLLLAVGVVLGPDVLGIVHPEGLGTAMQGLVGFAVSIILFEGGLNLSMAQLRDSAAPIQRLVTIGAAVTAVGATLAARLGMGWDWSISALFGSLMIVTGPTVVTPLVRRLRVRRDVATILEAEGVLIDPIGAIAAFVALEVVLHPTTEYFVLGGPDLLVRLVGGSLLGALGGAALSQVLRVRGLVPEEIANVFALSSVYAIYQLCEAVLHESGIAAVTVAGVVVRWLGTPLERELREFKEQLTVMLIGVLFVLLAADVRLADVNALGVPGLITVGALLFVVRPLCVLAATWGTTLGWKEKLFLSWIGPRGIVAASVASLFAVRLGEANMPGGRELQAMVFLVIAVSVTLAGLTGGWVARALGLRRPSHQGWVILGANALGRLFARRLGTTEAVLVDGDPMRCRQAQEEGLTVLQGNAMNASVMGRAALETRSGVIGLTRNEEVNLLFVQRARERARELRTLVALSDAMVGVTPDMVHTAHAEVLFGVETDVERWSAWIEGRQTKVIRFVVGVEGLTMTDVAHTSEALPLVLERGRGTEPAHGHHQLRKGEFLQVLVRNETETATLQRLTARGLHATSTGDDAAPAAAASA